METELLSDSPIAWSHPGLLSISIVTVFGHYHILYYFYLINMKKEETWIFPVLCLPYFDFISKKRRAHSQFSLTHIAATF